MSITSFSIKFVLVSTICLPISCTSLTVVPKPDATVDRNLSSRPLVRDPDPYERLDASKIKSVAELPIVKIQVRGQGFFSIAALRNY
jgi:hypothetical protein